jgi:hypothetical protein
MCCDDMGTEAIIKRHETIIEKVINARNTVRSFSESYDSNFIIVCFQVIPRPLFAALEP